MPSNGTHSRLSRRSLLAGTVTALAGCLGDDSSDEEFSTEAVADPSLSDYQAALEDHGIEIDSVMEMGGDGSVLYYRGEDPQQEIETLALAFVPYREAVEFALSFTALETQTERHGVGLIQRSWAADYAAGELDREAYVARVQDSYGPIETSNLEDSA